MNRRVIVLDRIAVVVTGAALVVAGGALAAWQLGGLSGAPDRLNLPWAADVADAGWWPAASGAAGVVLVLIGLRWLVAHRPNRRVHDIALPGSDATGRLEADLSALAGAAAESVRGLGVHSCTGRAVKDRGRPLLELVVTLEQRGSLADVNAAVERALDELAAATGSQVPTRVRVRAGRAAARTRPRVA